MSNIPAATALKVVISQLAGAEERSERILAEARGMVEFYGSSIIDHERYLSRLESAMSLLKELLAEGPEE